MIETQRLILRNYTMEDLADYWEYVSSPNVGPRCGWQPHTSIQQSRERLEYEIKRPLQFAIQLKESGKVIGSIEIMNPDKNTETDGFTKELGAILHEGYWNGGIMTETIFAIIKYCMEYLHTDNVVAGFFEPNIGSGKMQQKAGMEIVGRVKDYTTWYETGNPCDLILTKITKESYLNNAKYKEVNIKVTENKIQGEKNEGN